MIDQFIASDFWRSITILETRWKLQKWANLL